MSAVAQRKHVYHIDDLVTIVNPEVFVRVGYPLTKEMAIDAAAKEYSDKINAFMVEVSPASSEFTVYDQDPGLYNDLVDALASFWLRQKHYGGKERKIYTETNEALRNTKGWRVVSKRTVKTGIYNPGGFFGDATATEPDYDPPYLSNEKNHTLLMLECPERNADMNWVTVVEIEAANVIPDQGGQD